jgi:hypothetical protein
MQTTAPPMAVNSSTPPQEAAPVQPLVEAGGQQFAGAADVGAVSVHQKQHAEPVSHCP